MNNKKELQNIAINLSGEVDYNDFLKICRECTRKSYSFLTIDTTVTASDLLRFFSILIKMTVTDQLRIVDKNIKANQAQ